MSGEVVDLAAAAARAEAWASGVTELGADLDRCKARLAHLVVQAGWDRVEAMHRVYDEAASGMHGAT